MMTGYRTIAASLACVALLPLAATGASAVSHVSKKENRLLAAGFVDRPANTPERQAMLARLPEHKLARRVHGDTVTYVYGDAKGCNCLYVGSQQAYGRYQAQKQARDNADAQQMAAMDYHDAAWNWGAWGPFDGPWGGFGFGPGLGW